MNINLKFSDSGDVCPICYCEKLNNGEILILLSCKHCFHKKCITAWINTCPVCRKKITDEEKQEILSDKKKYFNELKLISEEDDL